MVPISPTAVPVLASVNETSKRNWVPGFGWMRPGRTAIGGVQDLARAKRPADRRAVARIGKGNAEKGEKRSAGLRHPCVSAIGRMENEAAFAHCRSRVCVSEGNAAQLKRRTADLRHPGRATIGRVENGTAFAHCRSVVGVGERNRPQVLGRPVVLNRPTGAAIRCPHDRAIEPHHRPGVRVDKGRAAKVVPLRSTYGTPFASQSGATFPLPPTSNCFGGVQ